MSTLVVVLRVVPPLAFAGAMLRFVCGHRIGSPPVHPTAIDRAPLVANLVAFGVYVASLVLFPGSSDGFAALWLAASGAFLGLVGAAVVVRARAALGPAWSFVARADRRTGLVTTGPYRLVRHPIYSGFLLLAVGEALAFTSWPAAMIVLAALAPTFVWRARAEERLLCRMFSDCYAVYRQRTRMMIPFLF
jgi:protein-S-isoprenylcysteine O-methyltransferase Ste14